MTGQTSILDLIVEEAAVVDALRLEQLEAEVTRLRRTLTDAATLLLHPETPAPARLRAVLTAAGIDPDAPATPEQRRDAGIARAAARWTAEELVEVDRAIRIVTLRAALVSDTFTADDVWLELGPAFPVTKGLAGRLLAAVAGGQIVNTGYTVLSTRGGAHGHRQRLSVWAPA